MPKLTDSCPKYRKQKRPDGSAVAFVQIDGKRRYLGEYRSKGSKVLYDRIVAEWLTNGRQSLHSQQETAKVLKLLAGYWLYAVKHYGKDAQESSDIKRSMRRIRALYGEMAADEFGPQQWKTIRQQVIDSGGSRPYTNQEMKRVTRIWKWGAGEGLVSPIVFQTLSLIPALRQGYCDVRETEPVKPVNDAMVQATLPHLPSVVADMVRVQRLCGCRPGEVCKLTPRMIDRSSDVWVATLPHHKNAHPGKTRSICFGPKCQEILLPYLLRGEDEHLFSPKDSEQIRRTEKHSKRATPLSCGNRPGTNRKRQRKRPPGDCYNTAAFAKAIARACQIAFPPPKSLKTKEQLKQWRREHSWALNQLRHVTNGFT